MVSKYLRHLRRHGVIRSAQALASRIRAAAMPLWYRVESILLRCLVLSHGPRRVAYWTLRSQLANFQTVRGNAASENAMLEAYRKISQLDSIQPSDYDPRGLWTLASRLRLAQVPEDLRERNDSFANFRVNSLSQFIGTGPRLDEIQAVQFPHAHYCSDLIRKYKALEACVGRKGLMDLCDDSPVGNPFGFEYAGKRINHHLLRSFFYFSRIVENCEIGRKPVILEIGAGFGGLARIFKECCPDAVYIVLDIPETAVMSYYYLRRCFPEAEMLVAEGGIADSIQLDCDFVFLSHRVVETIPPDEVLIVINTASFGEMDLEVSRNYVQQVLRVNPRYFYSVNHRVAIPKSLGTSDCVGTTHSCDEYLGPIHAANWNVKINQYAWIEDVAPAFARDGGAMRYWEMLFENPDGLKRVTFGPQKSLGAAARAAQ